MYDFAIPETTHLIRVQSLIKGAKSNRSFRISCNLSLENLYVLVKEKVTNDFEKILKKEIILTELAQNRQTHSITVLQKKDGKTKTFGIKYPEYSSEEIAHEIKKFLCGEKGGAE